MVLEKTLDDLRIEMGKLKGLVEKLKIEVKKVEINRNGCKHWLFELKANFLSIRQYFNDLLKFALEKETKQYQMNFLSLVLIFAKTYQNQKVEEMLDSLINKINSLATYEIDNPQWYDDTKIRNEIYDLTSGLDFFLNTFDSKIFKPLEISITGLSKIGEFTSQRILDLDENWAAAACYLSALDIAVNKKRKEFGLVKDDGLIRTIEGQHGEISKIIKQLPKSFWKIRTDVIHYGYSPNQDELELILNWSKKIIETLIQANIPFKGT